MLLLFDEHEKKKREKPLDRESLKNNMMKFSNGGKPVLMFLRDLLARAARSFDDPRDAHHS